MNKQKVSHKRERFLEMLSKPYMCSYKNQCVVIKYKATAVRKVYGPILLGIICHLMKVVVQGHYKDKDPLPHLRDAILDLPDIFRFPIPLKVLGAAGLKENSSFRWMKRAKVLVILHVAADCGNPNLQTSYNLSRMYSKLLSYMRQMIEPSPHLVYLFWLPSLRQIVEFKSGLSNTENIIIFFALDRKQLRSALSLFVVSSIHRIPWTGAIPHVVLLKCIGIREDPLTLPSTVDVDLSPTINRCYNFRSDTGCTCFDCTTEKHLLTVCGVHTMELNAICDPTLTETTDDQYHDE